MPNLNLRSIRGIVVSVVIFVVVSLAVYKIRTETEWLHFIFPPTCPVIEEEVVSFYGLKLKDKFGGYYSVVGFESGVTAEQILHDEGQLLTPSELVAGKIYYEVGEDYRSIIIVNRKAYRNLRGEWQYDYHYEEYPEMVMSGYFADKGAVPYSNGCWNKFNYLIPAEGAE